MACRRAVLPNSPGFKSRRINTCKRISKQTTSTPPESHSYKKHGGRGYLLQIQSVLFPRGTDRAITTHMSRITNSFLFRGLRALSPCGRSYLFPFQSLAASSAKTWGVEFLAAPDLGPTARHHSSFWIETYIGPPPSVKARNAVSRPALLIVRNLT